MPSTSVSFDVAVLAAAGQRAASMSRDGLRKACSLLHAQEAVNGKGKPKWEGGQYYHTEITVKEHTGITQYVDGFELYDPSAFETQQNPLFPMAISGLMMKIGEAERRLLGATDGALRHKVETLTESTMGFLQRQWQYRVLTGTGIGFTNWITLNGVDSSAGVFEQDAPYGGAQANVIGGLSKATYSGVLGWNNPVANLNNAFGTNQIGLFNLIGSTVIHKPLDKKKKIWLMTQAGCTNLKRVTQGVQRFTSTDPKDTDFGLPIEFYDGVKIYQESFLPTAGVNTGTFPMTALLLDLEDIFFAWGGEVSDVGGKLPGGYFGTGEWRLIGGLQNVIGCSMSVVGQTIVTDMGSSGLAYAGETF